MLQKNPKKSHPIFHCEICDYITGSKKDYHKHILTRKHQNATLMLHDPSSRKYVCQCGKLFSHHSSMYRHKKICEYDNYFTETNIVEHEQTTPRNDTMIQLLKQQMVIEQEREETRKEEKREQMEMMQTMLTQFKEIIPLVGNSTTHNTNCNNTFNMNVFLNETCKDAMNLDDFVKTLQFNTDDLLYTAENGYVEGVGKILLRGLDALSIEQRPIHCSDMKREVMYVKKDGVWEKDTADNEELRKTILLIGRMNVRSLPPWMKANPMYTQADSPFSDIYAQIIVNTLVESEEKGRNYTTKIIKNVAKRCHIDRKMKDTTRLI
jgi:hypothetical protein